jgi:hypothetical protein
MEHIQIPMPQEVNYLVKLRKVPIELDLHVVVEALKGKLASMLGIYRIYDYANNRRCEDILIVVRDELEYKVLQEMGVLLVRGREIYLEFPTFCLGAASKPKQHNNQFPPAPISLKIANLTEISRITTHYLEKILIGFESLNVGQISGLTLIYDRKKDSIRPFGFMTFTNEASMLQYHKQRVRVWDEIFSCESSIRVPVLLSEHNKFMIEENPAQLTVEMCHANLLCGIALEPIASNSSLVEAIASMQIDAGIQQPNEEQPQAMEHDVSDSESILSIEIDYDFDENMNLVKK